MTDTPTFTPVQNTTLSEAIARQMMALIAEGRLKPGDRLPTEVELMQQFNVGRSTLREALKSLAVFGLIETRRGAGTFVSENYTEFLGDRLKWAAIFGERELRHIIEVRRALEAQTAALAAERATPEQQRKLAELLDQLITADDPDQASEYDTAFHVTVAEASHNPLLHNLVLSVRNLIRDIIRIGYVKQGDRLVTAEENSLQHGPILDAIRARQPEAARQAMLDHLDYSARLMLAWANPLPQEAARDGS
jgi:GntR family transcriptional repressor for pyruvate dehydrogenase complex